MAVSLSVVVAKDGNGTLITGGLQAQDKSGTGSGPFTLGHIMIDGLAGTNMAAVTAANAVKVDGSAVTQPVSLTSTTITGTVAATQSGAWNITNVSGTVSLPTGASTSALQPTNAAQGSTTASQTGTMAMGAVTTAAPTYTTAQTSPFSLDTAGNLRVNVVTGGGSGGTSSSFGSTFPTVGTAIGGSDGTNMVALRVKAASTAPVATDPALVVSISPNSVNANGQATMANSAPVVIASNQSNLAVVGAGTAGTPSGGVVSIQGVASGTVVPVSLTSTTVTGTVAVTQSGTWTDTVTQATAASLNATVVGTGTFVVQASPLPVTSGGLTILSTLIASGTNATSVKSSAGQIYKIEVTNNSANIGYLKIYNTASAPTAGSGTPVIRLMCPGSASGAGAFSSNDLGVALSSGIGFTFTGGIADADTTSVAASAFIVNIYYK